LIFFSTDWAFADIRAHFTNQIENDPLFQDNYDESFFIPDPTEAEKKEAKEKFQKWIDTEVKDAKTIEDISAKIIKTFDTDQDGSLSAKELEALLEKADIGNWLTRSSWAKEIIEHFNCDTDSKLLSKEELIEGLKKLEIKQPNPTPTPSPSNHR